MTLLSFLVYLPAILSGGLILHLVWPERRPAALLLKFFVGIGFGLGLSSIAYFLALLIGLARVNMMVVEIGLAAILVLITFVRERGRKWEWPAVPSLSRLQWGLIVANGAGFCILTLTFITLIETRPIGSFDAWSIWNRAARFIYRDPENWRATLSPDLDWLSHADYPLLVPLNVARAWEAIGTETLRVPMMQGALFLLAGLGAMFAAVALTRTIGQAGLAALVLMGTPVFVFTGSVMIADIPVMFFIFSSGLLMFLSRLQEEPILLGLSGFMAGLAAWTKNEGLLFAAVGLLALTVADRENMPRSWMAYLAGLAIPMAVVLFFKSIAPESEFIADGEGGALAKIADPARYGIILKALGSRTLGFGDWPFSILMGLAAYALVMRPHLSSWSNPAARTLGALILLQFLGYCAIYVLSPYDLEWHVDTSLDRLILQLFPCGIFLFFQIVPAPEKVFSQSGA